MLHEESEGKLNWVTDGYEAREGENAIFTCESDSHEKQTFVNAFILDLHAGFSPLRG